MAGTVVSMATSTAEGIVGKLIEKMSSSVVGELSFLLGVRGEIQFIKDELEVMSAFLRSAENVKTNEAAKAWVKQVRELAYDAQDCIDEFSLHLTPPGGRNNNSWLCLWACTHRVRSLGKLRVRHQIAAEIQSIKSRVEDVSKRGRRYRIPSSSEASTSDLSLARHDPRLSALYVEESVLIGIDEHRQELVKLLLNKDKHEPSLVAVTGTGGLGKTTIARRVYESLDVTRHFDCRAWINVSQSYDTEVLLKDMIQQLIRREVLHEMNKKEPPMTPTEKLREHLQNKSYLIVFDDLWGITAWNSLQRTLPMSNNKGSRIIITTRKSDVAEFCRNQIGGDIHEHSTLSQEQSFQLFCRRLFLDHTCPKELENSSREIVEKCKGLPLAIISIAGVLAAKPKKDIKEWDDMLKHLSTEMETNPNLEEMRKVLDLSYNDLPYPVKRCYLYLSKYPEDHLIKCKDVLRLWVVEGFASSRRDMTAEEVAESYFNEIANRFLILPSMFYSSGKVKMFRVHDVLLEMIVSKSMEENFVTPVQEHIMCIPEKMIRYVSVQSGYFPSNLRLSRLRSLTTFKCPSSVNVLSEARFLRVLDLDPGHYIKEDDFNVISQLLHLRYLRFAYTPEGRCCAPCLRKVFPKSIGNLQKLETLDIKTHVNLRLPAEFLKLRELRFLFARGWILVLPRGIGRLANLQTLSLGWVEQSRLKGALKDLRMLTQLRNLELEIGGPIKPEHLEQCLRGLSKSLSSLKLYSTLDSDLRVLDSVDLLFHGLQRLKLTGGMEKVPRWVLNHHNIVKITLNWTFIPKPRSQEDCSVRHLGKLPNLIHLKLLWGALSYDDLHFEAGEFHVLRVLVLAPHYSVSFKEGALPRLESLVFRYSPGVGEVREISGIENLKNLKQIEADPDITSIDLGKLKEAVDKLEKPPKLIIREYTRN